MKTTSFLLLVVVALVGCKASDTKKDPDVGGRIGLITVPKERNYTASELVIGRRICAALKNKRVLFDKITHMQERFRFRGELKNCDSAIIYGQTEFTASISKDSATEYEYIATNRTNYFKDVVTDQNGAMRALCDSLATTDSISNTTLSGSSYLTVNLMISEGYDRFEVAKQSKDSAGNYNLVSGEAVSVITQKNQAPEAEKFFGVEKGRIRYSACSGSKDYSAVGQTWLTALTPF